MTSMRSALLVVILVGCFPSAASAHADPRIRQMQMHLTGHNPAGPSYYVRVQVRLRVCAVRGPASVKLKETLGLGGHTFGTHTRVRHYRQTGRCQWLSFRWKLLEEFFGVGTYRIRATARDKDSQSSNTVSRKVTTTD